MENVEFWTIGDNIKRIRKRSGMTQSELAKAIGKGASTVQKYELNITQPPIDVIQKISSVLNVSINEILICGNITINDGKTTENAQTESVKQGFEKFNSALDKFGHALNDDIKADTMQKFDLLNSLGQYKANEYITDLTEQAKYTQIEDTDEPNGKK